MRLEWLVGAGALLLLVSLFLLDWYSLSFRASDLLGNETLTASADGWHGHSVLRWFVLIVVAGGVALFVTTLARRDAGDPVGDRAAADRLLAADDRPARLSRAAQRARPERV